MCKQLVDDPPEAQANGQAGRGGMAAVAAGTGGRGGVGTGVGLGPSAGPTGGPARAIATTTNGLAHQPMYTTVLSIHGNTASVTVTHDNTPHVTVVATTTNGLAHQPTRPVTVAATYRNRDNLVVPGAVVQPMQRPKPATQLTRSNSLPSSGATQPRISNAALLAEAQVGL